MPKLIDITPIQANNPITISLNAARQVALLLKNENDPSQALRVSVSGGGCSGFQYKFTFDTEKTADDLIIKKEGIVVLIDNISAGYMSGSEIDYVDDLVGASFQIKNPNAVSSCGCGTSFSLV